MRKSAFTLAEVLVTLSVIGVIAALTIPTVNLNSQQNQNVAGCLKAYSSLSQMASKLKVKYGPIGLGAFWKNEAELSKAMREEMNVISFSDTRTSRTGVKYFNGDADTLPGYTFTTADGMIYVYGADQCSGKDFTDNDTSLCLGRFAVDVNGEKGPNIHGKDIFFFGLIRGQGVLPAGGYNNSADCVTGGHGVTCAAKVIKEKKINY